MFFKNRWYRTYFELLDAFRHIRCPLCHLLAQKESLMIEGLLASYQKPKRGRLQLKTLCLAHRGKIRAGDPAFLVIVKTLVKGSLWNLARSTEGPTAKWARWLRPPAAACALCDNLAAEEGMLCRALVGFLDDTEFWKGLQRSELLCLDHLEKCLAVQDRTQRQERLRDDQSEKLNRLLDDLIRFEATGTNAECRSTAAGWLADFAAPQAAGTKAVTLSGANRRPMGKPADADLDDNGHDPEGLLFENEKLKRKARDLLDRLNEVETRAASLHYRVSELTETNKRLELAYTGANTQANGLQRLVQDLRQEIRKLEQGKTENQSRAAS